MRLSRFTAALAIAVPAALLDGCGGESGSTAEDRAAAEASESAASASAASASAVEASESASASRSAEQQAEYTSCSTATSGLMAELSELNSRLNIGLNYDDYTEKLGDVQVAYDAAVDQLAPGDCLEQVGIPLERAFNKYVQVKNLWSECIADYNCTFGEGEVDRKVQERWADATKILERAEANLASLAPA